MAALPVPKDKLQQAVQEILETKDLGSTTTAILRSELESKFNLNEGELSNHRETISSLMDEYITSNLKQCQKSDIDDLDQYIQENIDNDNDNNSDHDNNHNHNNRNKSKQKKQNKGDIGIMDINYSDSSNSRLYDIFCDENGIKYSIMLNQTDINYGVRGHNKFYAIQLLQHKLNNNYKFICKWGRVGAKAQKSELVLDSEDVAVETFKKKFRDKTKNEFGKKKFNAVKGKYIPIGIQQNDDNHDNNDSNDDDMDIDDDDDDDDDGSQSEDNNDNNNNNKNNNNFDDEKEEIPPSKLNESLVRVLKIIFCKQLQLDTVKAFDYDLNRSPLGQLSKSQIDKGYNILCKLNDILVNNRNHINDNKKSSVLTSKYYTIIPHDFGHRLPPNINTLKRLHKELELIETLKQMLFTNKILNKRSKRKNPIDVHYNALHCDIQSISDYTKEYEIITKAIKGTHAITHNRYELKVMDIFEVNRKGSKFRHLPFRKAFEGKLNGNCKLLWHGTRLSNFVGILSQGLRIAPPEAPTTGYMFGKGLYFADCCSKSANYIHATDKHPFGLLILCEVALGNMYNIINAKYMDKPPNGYHSVKGIGKNIPQNIEEIDGYELSVGPLVQNNQQNVIENGNLLYNEYIVYDVGQVRMKYIVLTRFDFK